MTREETQDVAPRETATVFRAVNGTPAQNTAKVLEMLGGVEQLFGPEDVIVVKPNAQWWNQGGPNLSALRALVDIIMERHGGFRGEVVIAENCHRGSQPWNSPHSAWVRDFDRNSGSREVRNLGDLCDALKHAHGPRFSVAHWIDASHGAARVHSPADGEGYVYCDGTDGTPLLACSNGLGDERARTTVMTYPVFRTETGTVIDFRNGIWEPGGYTDRPLRFVNVCGINHHTLSCGATGAVKNYYGVTDLSGGPDPLEDGKLTGDYYNFHAFALDRVAPGPVPGMLGRAVGTFLKTVRMADLNLMTAEWTGLVSRLHPPVAHTRAVLACRDPVALDYHACKRILYANSRAPVHDPDHPCSPLGATLTECARAAGLSSGYTQAEAITYDIAAEGERGGEDLRIIGRKHWGKDPRRWASYAYVRLWR